MKAVDIGGMPITFSGENHQASQQVFLTQIRDGKITKIK